LCGRPVHKEVLHPERIGFSLPSILCAGYTEEAAGKSGCRKKTLSDSPGAFGTEIFPLTGSGWMQEQGKCQHPNPSLVLGGLSFHRETLPGPPDPAALSQEVCLKERACSFLGLSINSILSNNLDTVL